MSFHPSPLSSLPLGLAVGHNKAVVFSLKREAMNPKEELQM